MHVRYAADAADLVYAVPALRALGNDVSLSLSPASPAAAVLPLLNAQTGLRAAVDSNIRGLVLNGWTRFPRPGFNRADQVQHWLSQPHWPRERPWLTVPKATRAAPVLFARSLDRHHPAFPWPALRAAFAGRAAFVGTAAEHAAFEAAAGPVPLYLTNNLLEVAEALAGADLFVGNECAARAVAEGLKVPVIVEESPMAPDTHWARRGAAYGPAGAAPPPDLAAHWVESVLGRADGRTLLPADRLRNIATLARRATAVPGDAAELGVCRGGSAAVICSALPGRQVHLIDTFAGLPADDTEAGGHVKGEFAADFTDVQDFLRIYRPTYVRGYFPAVTPATNGPFAFVHLDGDLYETTRDAVAWFSPRMAPGGVLVFDDYAWPNCPGVKRAIDEAGLQVTVGPHQAWWTAPGRPF